MDDQTAFNAESFGSGDSQAVDVGAAGILSSASHTDCSLAHCAASPLSQGINQV
jgi:hypothetical protein